MNRFFPGCWVFIKEMNSTNLPGLPIFFGDNQGVTLQISINLLKKCLSQYFIGIFLLALPKCYLNLRCINAIKILCLPFSILV